MGADFYMNPPKEQCIKCKNWYEIREGGVCTGCYLADLERQHEGLLNTLAPSKSKWVQHIWRNATAYCKKIKEEYHGPA
ncbi:MAG: hypothetical protein GY906_24675 [bacterium]|nr:hypothetical protein [bacterium]